MKLHTATKYFIFFITLCAFAFLLNSCDKEFRCDCYQDVSGFDTTYTLVGEGRDANKTCDAFDSETTEFGITKTVDCEPF